MQSGWRENSDKVGEPTARRTGSARSDETRKMFFVAQGPHIPERLLKRLEQAANAQGKTVRLPSGALHADAFRLDDVEDSPAARERLRAVLDGEAVDFGFVPGDQTLDRLKLAMYDMDQTLIQDDSAAELRELIPGAPEKEMELRAERNRRGLSIFDTANKIERTHLLANLSEETIAGCVKRLLARTTPGATTMIENFRPHAKQVVASGGFSVVVDPVAAALGLDDKISIKLEMTGPKGNRRTTGEILGRIVLPAHKADWMQELRAVLPEWALALAVGDGLNDTEMFEAAHISVAYHAVPPGASDGHRGHAVEAAATYALRHAGLDAVPNLVLPAAKP